MIKKILLVAVIQNNSLSFLIHIFSFLKITRFAAWLFQFNTNCKMQKAKRNGPLTTLEIQDSTTWTKRVQDEHSMEMKIENHKVKLLVEKNKSGILICRRRLQGT